MKPLIKYKSGYKYQTVQSYSIQVAVFPKEDVSTHFLALTTSGILTIARGYAWDGPSGKVTIHTKSFMRGSLVHDALYQLLRMELIPPHYRLEADEELRRICLEDGMWAIRAWWVYHAVRLAGGPSADPMNKKEILIAP